MSQISTDTIKGVTSTNNITLGNTPIVSASANSLTIRGEGSAQTSVQQGLCKAWNHINDADASTIVQGDSFNMSSAIDNGVGRFRFPFTNNMANANYLHVGNPGPATDLYMQVALKDDYNQNSVDSRSTSSFAIRIRNNGNLDDDVEDVGVGFIGDLA
tara:strand:- start:716 stop:1189 length:474 start_codon:yes stop_codon:yes gene_type:complete